MASNFNQEKYRKVFEQRFGQGSYQSGISNARDIGVKKAQAQFEEAKFNDRMSEVKSEQKKVAKKKKEEEDNLKLLQEAKAANDKKKDNSFMNKNVVKPFKNFLGDITDNKKKSSTPAKFNLSVRDGGTGKPKGKSDKDKDKGNILKDFLNASTGAIKSVNPFDDEKFGDSLMKNAMEFDKKKSNQFDEVARSTGRTVNTTSLGLMGNLDKKMRDGETPHYLTKRKMGEGGGADVLSDLLGYAVPGTLIAGGLRGTKLGADTTLKALSKKGALSRAKEGAVVGGIMGGAEVAGNEALNPKDHTWKQNLAQVGLETAGGAILDPLLSAGGSLIGAGGKKLLNKFNQPPKMNFDDVKELESSELPFTMNEPPPTVKPAQQTVDNGVFNVDEVRSKHPELFNADGSTNFKKMEEWKKTNLDEINSQGPVQTAATLAPVRTDKPFESIVQSSTPKLDENGKPIKIDKNKKYKDLADNAMRNSDLWKDKKPLLYGRETLERNFEDIASKEDAQFLKDNYVEPVRAKEAERFRFVNDLRKTVKSFGIKPKSQIDKLTQMYGEGKINLDNLKRETPDWKKIVDTAQWYRKTYDELITTVNKALDDAGEKMIPVREDYFPHYQEVEGIFNQLKKKLGFDVENNSLPTDINGLTQNYKPNKKWFGNAMRRKTDETTFGAIEGFDRYVEGVSQLIYHTDNIKRIRALENGLRSKHAETTHLTNMMPYLQEQGNLMAGKKASIDRGIEEKVGRGVYNALDTIKRRTGMNMLGYSVSSASSALIPLTQAVATTSKKAFARGMSDTITNLVRNDGFVNKSDFLTRRVGSKPLVSTLVGKVENNSMAMMEMVDRFTSQTIVRGKYYELLDKGIPEAEALKQADNWAGRIMTDRSKGQQPTLFATRALGPLMQFQVEVNNQVSFILKDIPRSAKNKAQLASQMTQILVFSYLYNEAAEKVLGRRPAFDPAGVAVDAYKNFGNEDMGSKEATGKLLKDVAGQLPFTATFTGGRYPVSSAIPSLNIDDYTQGKTTLGKEAMKPLKYLTLPTGGGQINKIYEGSKILNDEGAYTEKGNLKYPVENNTENLLRGLILGKSSLPETKEYYDKPFGQRKALGSNQTKEYEYAKSKGLGKEFYDITILNRNEKSKKDKLTAARKEIDEIKKDTTLSDKEREKRIEKILKTIGQ